MNDLPGQEQYDTLEAKADAVVSDIRGDMEADGRAPEGADWGYNLYIEKLGPTTFGVIDMGDLYQGAFEWYGGEWCQVSHDPYELVERILRKRGAGV